MLADSVNHVWGRWPPFEELIILIPGGKLKHLSGKGFPFMKFHRPYQIPHASYLVGGIFPFSFLNTEHFSAFVMYCLHAPKRWAQHTITQLINKPLKLSNHCNRGTVILHPLIYRLSQLGSYVMRRLRANGGLSQRLHMHYWSNRTRSAPWLPRLRELSKPVWFVASSSPCTIYVPFLAVP